MFDVERFVADCRAANAAAAAKPVREVVARAVADPAAVLHGLGEPKRSGIQTLFRSPELTVINVVWAPNMIRAPHDHRMWAVIGIYTGREDNVFWRRVHGAPKGKIEAAGATALMERHALPLGPDIIHSVINPISRLTGAIHVYGGDFFAVARSDWDPETLHEGPCDPSQISRLFEDANVQPAGAHGWPDGRDRRA